MPEIDLAEKYNMPELKQVQLYDFRQTSKQPENTNYQDTTFYTLKQILGHKDARSTEKYISKMNKYTWIPIKCTTDEEIRTSHQRRLHLSMPSRRNNILQKTSIKTPKPS